MSTDNFVKKGRYTIFIIDDSKVKLELTKRALAESYDVITASSGKEALAILERITPDLFLLDVEMPDMDGYEVITKIKSIEKLKDIPVIFLTALTDKKNELYGLSLGAVDYIITPFSPPLLLKRLELHLSLVEQKNELHSFNNNLKKLITEQTDDLRKALHAAKTADRTKTAFLANMSHEIRTPLNSIIGFSELARAENSLNKTKGYIDNILDNAGRLLDIVTNILDIPNIESGQVVLDKATFELHDVLAYCKSAVIHMAEEKGISLHCSAEPYVGKMLIGDSDRLRQVIMNLLNNAVKFTSSGTVELLTSVSNSSESSITIDFEVKDSGIGISAEQIETIFEPFMLADDSMTRKSGGVGLGLTIAKNIIESMGGKLAIESVAGVGSKFSFTLTFDLADDNESETSRKVTFSDFEMPNFTGEVLVCEDNDLNQQVICDHLARVGLKTVVAHNGRQGLEIVEARARNNEKPFDLIFMDIHMPVMDGMTAASKIIGLGIESPIVALTANVMSYDLELYESCGMSDTIGKPFTSHELWRCLVKYIHVDGYTAIDIKRQASEENETLRRLKLNFVKSNQSTFSVFITAVNDGDIKLAHRIAHTLKSNAGQLGEKRLQTIAAQAEKMLAGEVNKLSSEHTENLESELRRVLDGLSHLLVETKAVNEPENMDADNALALFDKLEPLLKSKDTQCLKLLDEISAISGTRELVEQIEGYKFKKALESLDGLRKGLV